MEGVAQLLGSAFVTVAVGLIGRAQRRRRTKGKARPEASQPSSETHIDRATGEACDACTEELLAHMAHLLLTPGPTPGAAPASPMDTPPQHGGPSHMRQDQEAATGVGAPQHPAVSGLLHRLRTARLAAQPHPASSTSMATAAGSVNGEGGRGASVAGPLTSRGDDPVLRLLVAWAAAHLHLGSSQQQQGGTACHRGGAPSMPQKPPQEEGAGAPAPGQPGAPGQGSLAADEAELWSHLIPLFSHILSEQAATNSLGIPPSELLVGSASSTGSISASPTGPPTPPPSHASVQGLEPKLPQQVPGPAGSGSGREPYGESPLLLQRLKAALLQGGAPLSELQYLLACVAQECVNSLQGVMDFGQMGPHAGVQEAHAGHGPGTLEFGGLASSSSSGSHIPASPGRSAAERIQSPAWQPQTPEQQQASGSRLEARESEEPVQALQQEQVQQQQEQAMGPVFAAMVAAVQGGQEQEQGWRGDQHQNPLSFDAPWATKVAEGEPVQRQGFAGAQAQDGIGRWASPAGPEEQLQQEPSPGPPELPPFPTSAGPQQQQNQPVWPEIQPEAGAEVGCDGLGKELQPPQGLPTPAHQPPVGVDAETPQQQRRPFARMPPSSLPMVQQPPASAASLPIPLLARILRQAISGAGGLGETAASSWLAPPQDRPRPRDFDVGEGIFRGTGVPQAGPSGGGTGAGMEQGQQQQAPSSPFAHARKVSQLLTQAFAPPSPPMASSSSGAGSAGLPAGAASRDDWELGGEEHEEEEGFAVSVSSSSAARHPHHHSAWPFHRGRARQGQGISRPVPRDWDRGVAWLRHSMCWDTLPTTAAADAAGVGPEGIAGMGVLSMTTAAAVPGTGGPLTARAAGLGGGVPAWWQGCPRVLAARLRLVCSQWRDVVDGEVVTSLAPHAWPAYLHHLEHFPRLVALDCSALATDACPLSRAMPLLVHAAQLSSLRRLALSKDMLLVSHRFAASAPRADLSLVVSFPAGLGLLQGLSDLAVTRRRPRPCQGLGLGPGSAETQGRQEGGGWDDPPTLANSAGNEWLRVRMRPDLASLTRLTSLVLHDAANPLQHAPPSLRHVELRGRACCAAALPDHLTRLTRLTHLTLAEPAATPALTATLDALALPLAAAAAAVGPNPPAPPMPPPTPPAAPQPPAPVVPEQPPAGAHPGAPPVYPAGPSAGEAAAGGEAQAQPSSHASGSGAGSSSATAPSTSTGSPSAPTPPSTAGAAATAATLDAHHHHHHPKHPKGLQQLVLCGVRQALLGLGQGQLLGDEDWRAIGALTSLRALRITTCTLGSIDPAGALAALGLGGVTLDVPASAQLPPSLEVLDLGGNNLVGLPPSTSRLTRLQRLGLQRSALPVLPRPLLATPLPGTGTAAAAAAASAAATAASAAASVAHAAAALVGLGAAGSGEEAAAAEDSEGGVGLLALRELNLQGCMLTSLPPSLHALSGLARLDLRNNSLTDLPRSLSSMAGSLTLLLLGHNALGPALPAPVYELCRLRLLDISFNAITHLNPAIAHLSALTRLDASFNRLTSLPPALACLAPSLRSLDLSTNALPALPPVVLRLRSLAHLDISAQCTMHYEHGKGIVILSDSMRLGLDLGGDWALRAGTGGSGGGTGGSGGTSGASSTCSGPGQQAGGVASGDTGAAGSATPTLASAPAAGGSVPGASPAAHGSAAPGPHTPGAAARAQLLPAGPERSFQVACPLSPDLVLLPRLKLLVVDRPIDVLSLMTVMLLERLGVAVDSQGGGWARAGGCNSELAWAAGLGLGDEEGLGA